MSEQLYHEAFSIVARDFATAGEASGRIKSQLKKLGVDAGVIRQVSVAAYEAELNLVIHSDGGEMQLTVTPEEVVLGTRDVGPGIPDIDQAMTEGYSTAPHSVREMGFGAGMGLANMRRCADGFAITSTVGVGTEITMRFAMK